MIHFILQIILFQLVFLLTYELLLKKETFFTYNRWYLLLTPLIALLLPLLKFESLVVFVPAETVVMLPEVFIGGNPEVMYKVAAQPVENGLQINWWLVIYAIGFTLSSFMFFRKYRNLKKLFQFKIVSEEKELKIIEVPNSKLACTFYRTVFLGDRLTEPEKQHILPHELVHVRQKHSLDLVFFELQKILFWFNPLVYVYQSKIAGLHEYIADAKAVKNSERKNYYQQLLNTAFSTQNISFINQFFSQSLIKKRIVMLQRSRSKAILKIKYLVLVPLMLVMLTYVACSEDLVPRNESTKSLEQYEYTMRKGEEMSAETRIIHNKYEAFLKNNPNYVSWATINHETGTITYTVHPKEEEVPEGYTDLKYNSPDGSSYISYMNLKSVPKSQVNSNRKVQKAALSEIVIGKNGEVLFEDVEEAPVYPGCEGLASKEARKTCMSEKIRAFVNSNFNMEAMKAYTDVGIHRILTKFRVNKSGIIDLIEVRTEVPELEIEVERVIGLLPKMAPGKQNNKEVGVIYSLPITYKIAK